MKVLAIEARGLSSAQERHAEYLSGSVSAGA
jgi:hypothetical protein